MNGPTMRRCIEGSARRTLKPATRSAVRGRRTSSTGEDGSRSASGSVGAFGFTHPENAASPARLHVARDLGTPYATHRANRSGARFPPRSVGIGLRSVAVVPVFGLFQDRMNAGHPNRERSVSPIGGGVGIERLALYARASCPTRATGNWPRLAWAKHAPEQTFEMADELFGSQGAPSGLVPAKIIHDPRVRLVAQECRPIQDALEQRRDPHEPIVSREQVRSGAAPRIVLWAHR